MRIFTFIAIDNSNGAPVSWVFDSEDEYTKARNKARKAGRLLADADEDFITDADEFANWHRLTRKAKRQRDAFNPAIIRTESALVLLAYHTLQNHSDELQREDGTEEENKAFRDCAIANAIEDAAALLGVELPEMRDKLGAVHAAVHKYADANYSIS